MAASYDRLAFASFRRASRSESEQDANLQNNKPVSSSKSTNRTPAAFPSAWTLSAVAKIPIGATLFWGSVLLLGLRSHSSCRAHIEGLEPMKSMTPGNRKGADDQRHRQEGIL